MHQRVFGGRQRGKKETAEHAADQRAADQHDMVSQGSQYPLPTPSGHYLLTYFYPQMVLLIRLMQQHVMATHVLADTTLEVACNKQCVV
jgi:hypothetical protein